MRTLRAIMNRIFYWVQTILSGCVLCLICWGIWPQETKESGAIAYTLTFSCGFFLSALYHTFRELRGSIKRALRFLQKSFPDRTRVLAASQLSEVDDFFSKDPFLAGAWQEFYEGITTNDEDPKLPAIYNSDNSPAFFDEYSVIESNMHTQFWVNLPGMFTAVGILGTFYGLIKTLRSIKTEGTNDQAVSMVMEALPGMHLAFYCSLLGVGFYVLFSLIERWLMSILTQLVSTLQSRIDAIFIRIPEQRFLKEAVNLLTQQDAKFKTLNHTLAVEVGTEIKRNLDGHLTDIVEAMKAVIGQLVSSREETSRQQQDFQVAIRESIGTSLNPLFEGIHKLLQSQTTTATDKIASVLGGVLENLGSNLERASAEASVGFRAAAENLGTTLIECNHSMQHFASEIGDLGNVVRSSAEGFNSSAQLFSEASERGGVILNGLSEAMSLVEPALQANERTLNGCYVIADKAGVIADSLSSTVERFSQSTHEAIEQVDRSSQNLERLTENYATQSAEVSRSLANTASTAVASFDRTRAELANVFTILEGQMSGYRESLDTYNHTVREGLSTIFRAFDQETENLVTSYAGICSTTRKTSMEMASYTEDMCKSNINAMKESAEAIVKLSQALSTIMQQGSTLDQLELRLKEMFNDVKNSKSMNGHA